MKAILKRVAFFMNYINPNITIKETEKKGKGIFARASIDSNSLIEISPVIVLSEADTKLIHNTHLHDYYFSWGEKQNKSAIALGYVSLYNHSNKPNCYHECDFDNNTISIFAKDKIEKNEELFIDYNMGEEKELWFNLK